VSSRQHRCPLRYRWSSSSPGRSIVKGGYRSAVRHAQVSNASIIYERATPVNSSHDEVPENVYSGDLSPNSVVPPQFRTPDPASPQSPYAKVTPENHNFMYICCQFVNSATLYLCVVPHCFC
jgi:hypothetical protein